MLARNVIKHKSYSQCLRAYHFLITTKTRPKWPPFNLTKRPTHLQNRTVIHSSWWSTTLATQTSRSQMKNKRPTWCHVLFYFTSYVLNMFRTLIYPSSGACVYSVELLHWSYCSWFDVCWRFGVAGWSLQHETPTHIETRTHNQCGDTIEKSQAPGDGCINTRNMLSVEEVK